MAATNRSANSSEAVEASHGSQPFTNLIVITIILAITSSSCSSCAWIGRFILGTKLCPEQYVPTHISPSSTEVWRTVERLFITKSKARILQLHYLLQSTHNGSMSIADYIWKLRGIADTLSAAGQVIIDEELVMYILGGLNCEYDPAVINLTSRNADVSLEEAQFLLQRVQKYPNSNFYHGKGRGTDGRGNESELSQIRNAQGDGQHQAYIASPETVMDSNWHMGSGATNHITANLNDLTIKDNYRGKRNSL
ncbi:hypothetical protein CK203_021540 [Vitis vinifera]|uniref:Retrovirus-related Pol polyprotein from transposon RE1 n=1 Tax=Vitis vinifera TaxID=29760 RepID=A0A438ISH4_VITVI|nr:hypothetical protein CK203_021540 [Vitis vinifera]